jgi:outer membrane protein OmpA-like peptidoglycan-associated protein
MTPNPQTSRARARRRSAPALAAAASLWALAAVPAGCGTPPKPPELDAFEKLRRDPVAEEAQKRAPDLMKAADRHLREAREQWEGGDLEESRNSSLLGQIKLKHALAIVEQERARRRIATADEETRRAEDEYAQAQKELAALNEQIALLKKLQDAASERQRLAAEQQKTNEALASERLKAAATEKIAAAELALKTADTVEAATHARVPYQTAKDNLARAQQEMQQNNFQAAQTSAEMAKLKAEEAEKTAKPLYEKEAAAADTKAKAEALVREATAIPGITVRRDARGSLQRIVLPLRAEMLFVRTSAALAPGRDALLEPIASLAKKYPNFQIMVVGHSDNRGRTGEQLAMSQARAQSVFTGLVSRGVDAKRMIVSGQGAGEPVADNRTATGRAANSRVEIIFLYQ